MKKVTKALSLALAAIITLTACGGAGKSGGSGAGSSEGSGAFVTYEGTNVTVGGEFEGIKDKLGTETKPMETIEPCDGGDYIQIMHYYDGITVTTLRDEKVISIEPAEGGSKEILIQGKVKMGDSADDVKKALGDPENESDGMMSYTVEGTSVMIYLEGDSVSGFMYMNMGA